MTIDLEANVQNGPTEIDKEVTYASTVFPTPAILPGGIRNGRTQECFDMLTFASHTK